LRLAIGIVLQRKRLSDKAFSHYPADRARRSPTRSMTKI
jgi:hypothetical protein